MKPKKWQVKVKGEWFIKCPVCAEVESVIRCTIISEGLWFYYLSCQFNEQTTEKSLPELLIDKLERYEDGPPRYSADEIEKIHDYLEQHLDINSVCEGFNASGDDGHTDRFFDWLKTNPVKIKKILEEME